MQRWVVVCWALLALVGADLCPDGRRCEDGQTCCDDPASGYECCPFDQAECCEDHIHCCPAATVCDVTSSSCVNATVSVPWVERASHNEPRLSKSFRMIKPYMGEGEDNICPDLSRCPPEFSCLRALTKFGCCPLAQGVPCSDGKHCCPEEHQCSGDSRSCIRKELVTAVPCSDGKSECPDGTTCCETPEGKWGCCPMPKAVCCEDKIHCCPEGSTCDVEHSKCVSLSTKKATPMWEKLPARIRAEWENETGEQMTAEAAAHRESESTQLTTANTVPPSEEEVSVSSVAKAAGGNDVACSDTAGCPENNTCCKSQSGKWECCPLPKAIPRLGVEARNVACDSMTSCPDGTTCCKNSEGGWSCCPMPEAVCCEDMLHCCPKGTKCNLAAQTCDGDTGSLPWMEKVAAIPRLGVEARNVACDSMTSCPDGTTCCKNSVGGWSCCPMPEAVCCEDMLHCCPKGTKCNLAAQTCDGDTGSLQWMEKVAAIPRLGVEARNVTCDAKTSCPDGTTCCKNSVGGWSCCPMPEAVCCEDMLHCCPKGTKCNLAAQTCDGDTGSLPWMEKVAAIPRLGVEARNVTCDAKTSCPDGTTCCKNSVGGWSCCPMPEAVCCEDMLHCCPKGTKCNLAAQTCDGDMGSLPWMEKVAAIPRLGVEARNVTCDAKTSCPDGTTCCKNTQGGWSCCPLPEAVCCDDHEHCCPSGTTCDLSTLTCHSASGSTPMTLKKSAFTEETSVVSAEVDETWNENKAVQNRVRCDDRTSCPQDTTCCFMASTHQWGCCPLPRAVCCADGSHCCPSQYKCDIHKTSCVKGEVVIPWYTKLQATTGVDAPAGSEQCDGLKLCPKDTTCCRLSSGEWGCCPMQNAVCCPDQEHCCPQGYTCNMASKSCQKLHVETLLLTPVLPPEHQPSSLKSQDVPCDETTSCKDGQTCCRMSATTWGCCPFPNAVCCKDMKHCCQAGYTCTDTGDCTKDARFHWFNWHMFLANSKRALVV